MHISFHGAARTVTGSQHLIDVNGQRILLDCGLFQGKRKEAFERNRRAPFDPETVDVVVLSHAHIDHSGNLPSLYRRGFRGDIVSTFATRSLCANMLLDSAHIQERDVEYTNKKRARKGQNLFEPLYTQEDARDTMSCFLSIAYDRQREIAPGVYLTFVDAGHMLGSASVILDIEDQESKQDVRVVFSGDIGRKGIPIIRDPQPITEGADVLIMESTYGGRFHEPYADAEGELKRVVREAYNRRGVLIIPAFAVGRTQQIVYALHQLFIAGELPELPIYVDSPLATNVTEVFRMHPETYDDEMREFIRLEEVHNPFGFSRLQYTRSVEQSKELNTKEGPFIVISASGMVEAGRILHHVKNRIEDPANTILFVGYQGQNTLGRRILEHTPPYRVFGEEYELRARVEQLEGFSGHAGHDELLVWAGAMQKKPSRTFLVHGEEEAALTLADAMRGELGFPKVEVPHLDDTYDITL